MSRRIRFFLMVNYFNKYQETPFVFVTRYAYGSKDRYASNGAGIYSLYFSYLTLPLLEALSLKRMD